ncbi:hypothetical protein [Mycolicibacterium sp.]|uniref:bestrophin-like domain n=1 Tax=Mycolicibacterium sp. TaxID=2320850 RepID=UPI001A22A1E0|nr:hypothetical protein [Mycolicibacterium sp.]MBJ7401668.1 hypothetical protein [Mycolicibacterium sp.]
MRDLIIALPLWLIVAVLLVFFCGVIFTARWLISRRCGEDAREELVDQAKSLLTGLAATFAFFVGFAITVTWGAVSAGQVAVEQQAASIQQMAWKLNSIAHEAESTALMDKLRTYALTAATEDDPYLIRGDTTNLPSTIPLDHFEDALHTYAFGPTAAPQEVNSLVTAAATVGTNSATVSAVAQRSLPGVLTTLLLTSGVLVAVVMGIMTVTSRRPALMYVWALVPALSITVVIALAFPFAHGIGVNLAPLQAVAGNLVAH